MINVSLRIENIVNLIENDTLVDIGCDHGFIPIYAVHKKGVKRAIACDLNKEPLLSCQNNIEKYNMQNNIDTLLSNGLENVECDYKTCTIGGMGGLLVTDIIGKYENKTKKFSQLILQPQSDYAQVRKKIYELGFYIKEEVYLIDNLYKKNIADKYYIIFNCIKGESVKPTDSEILLGVNISKNSTDIYKKYINMLYEKSILAYNNLCKNAKTDISDKKTYYENLIKHMEATINDFK